MDAPRTFYSGKTVFITGHTGFKGAWLCAVLARFGAKVFGYALPPVPNGAFEAFGAGLAHSSTLGDVRDFEELFTAYKAARPDIVLHLAAQPLVIDAFYRPAYTFETNVSGTVNLLECVRLAPCARSVIIVTTDKVYRNNEWVCGYRETDELGGDEPYSAGKACAEMVSDAYNASFLRPAGVAVSNLRAGNVIGGGDVSENRIIPDCIRAAKAGRPILVRNPASVRPYQHVLEPLFAYLETAQLQYDDVTLAGHYNVGPSENDCVTTETLVNIFCENWGNGQTWQTEQIQSPKESGFLRLDCSKLHTVLGIKPKWSIAEAVEKTIDWEMADDKPEITNRQIASYLGS